MIIVAIWSPVVEFEFRVSGESEESSRMRVRDAQTVWNIGSSQMYNARQYKKSKGRGDEGQGGASKLAGRSVMQMKQKFVD